jgi:hypothetical protein
LKIWQILQQDNFLVFSKIEYLPTSNVIASLIFFEVLAFADLVAIVGSNQSIQEFAHHGDQCRLVISNGLHPVRLFNQCPCMAVEDVPARMTLCAIFIGRQIRMLCANVACHRIHQPAVLLQDVADVLYHFCVRFWSNSQFIGASNRVISVLCTWFGLKDRVVSLL